MATVTIQNLPAATTPLTGAELVPLVQGGVTKQTAMTNALANPYYAITAAETTANITPEEYSYQVLLPQRYGGIGDGAHSSEDAAAWTSWRQVANSSTTNGSWWGPWARTDPQSFGLGYKALKLDNTGTENTAVGYNVMPFVSGGVRNTTIGSNSMRVATSAYQNSGLGSNTFYSITSGTRNVAVGTNTLYSVTNESESTAIGASALYNSNAAKNTAVGREAGFYITTGLGNTVMGYDAMLGDAVAFATGDYNCAYGYQALLSATTAARNVAVGFQALAIATTAYTNTCIGYGSGSGITTGQYNVVIGGDSGASIATLSNRVIISDGVGTQRLTFNATGQATFLAPQIIASTGYFIVDATNGLRVNNATDTANLASITNAGALRLFAYGAGTLTSDASGNITSVSDEQVKTSIRPYGRGLREILALEPILHGYTRESGLDQSRNDYAGFSAQNVRNHIPEAVGENENGTLSLSDRPILAALVNAIKELNARMP